MGNRQRCCQNLTSMSDPGVSRIALDFVRGQSSAKFGIQLEALR